MPCLVCVDSIYCALSRPSQDVDAIYVLTLGQRPKHQTDISLTYYACWAVLASKLKTCNQGYKNPWGTSMVQPMLLSPLQSYNKHLNYHPVEVVSRYRDPQLQLDENYSILLNLRRNILS